MSYTELTRKIISYANRTDLDVAFVSALPYFIAQAQERIWLEAKDIGFETLTTKGDFRASNPIVRKPTNWNKTVSFSIIDTDMQMSILEMRTYEYCIANWPHPSVAGDVDNPPLYYCDREFKAEGDDNPNYAEDTLANTPYSAWFISPTPDHTKFFYQATYLAWVQNINDANPTNILTIKFPNLLLYAAMCEAFSWTGEPERLQVFEGMYKGALNAVNTQTDSRHTDRASTIGVD